MPVNTGRKQDTRFKPGESGNPAGKPRGARHKTTLACDLLLEGEAKSGDGPALRLCMERIAPARKDRPVNFALPSIETVADHGPQQPTLFVVWGKTEEAARQEWDDLRTAAYVRPKQEEAFALAWRSAEPMPPFRRVCVDDLSMTELDLLIAHLRACETQQERERAIEARPGKPATCRRAARRLRPMLTPRRTARHRVAAS